jgi:competence protein ComEA
MPTPSEQKALAFVAIVILLGGAVRVVRAGAADPPNALEQQALAQQASAADSAALRRGAPKRPRPAKSKRGAEPKTVAGVSTIPPSFARPDRPYDTTPYGAPSERLGFPPPGPRIDIGGPAPRTPGPGTPDRVTVDMDLASAAEIEALPRIGPALARRIVANRDSLGPFRSLEGLRRVKGIGKATIELLAPSVTFGGVRR